MSHKISSRNDPENQFWWNKGLIVRILLLTFFLKDPVHIMCNFTHSVLFYIHFWAASKVLVGIRYWFPSAVQHFATVFKHFLCSVSTFLPSLIIFQPFPHCISTFPPLYFNISTIVFPTVFAKKASFPEMVVAFTTEMEIVLINEDQVQVDFPQSPSSDFKVNTETSQIFELLQKIPHYIYQKILQKI